MNEQQNSRSPHKRRRLLRFLLIAVGVVLVGAAVWLLVPSRTIQDREQFGTVDEDLLRTVPADQIPEGALYITEGRRDYVHASMDLVIPILELNTPIGDSTDPAGLEEMPGLYEFSQLPMEGDFNVSIAGHRDIHGQEFYYLDRLTGGDYLYLIYGGLVYRYQYVDTKIVSSTSWEVIAPQGFSCLTLTTCDPIGTSLNRMIVRGELRDIAPHTEDYIFITSAAQPGG